jgi:hypothetical protein
MPWPSEWGGLGAWMRYAEPGCSQAQRINRAQ